MRGDVYRLRSPRATRGHEQRGARYAVEVQSDDLPLSTLLSRADINIGAPSKLLEPRSRSLTDDLLAC